MSAASGLPALELVVVTYRSRAQVEAMLAGLPEELPVVVVDNSDSDDGTRALVEARPAGRYLRGGGVGFARAANAGVRAASADVVVLVNPDTRPDLAALAALAADLERDPALLSSAALLVDGEGRGEMGAGGWEPSLLRTAVHASGLHGLRPSAGLYATPQPGAPCSVDWTSGGCMAVRRSTFLELGGFDEDFYVYGEDVALGRTARQRGLRQVLRTDVLVPSSSGGSGAPSLEMMRLRGASFRRYAAKHHAAPVATAMGAVAAAGYLVRELRARTKGDAALASQHRAWAVGALTARATVAGHDVTGPLPPRSR